MLLKNSFLPRVTSKPVAKRKSRSVDIKKVAKISLLCSAGYYLVWKREDNNSTPLFCTLHISLPKNSRTTLCIKGTCSFKNLLHFTHERD